MKNYKRIIFAGVAAALCFSFAGCDLVPAHTPEGFPDGFPGGNGSASQEVTQTQWTEAFLISAFENVTVNVRTTGSALGQSDTQTQHLKINGNKLYYNAESEYYQEESGGIYYQYTYNANSEKWEKAETQSPYRLEQFVESLPFGGSYSDFTYADGGYSAADITVGQAVYQDVAVTFDGGKLVSCEYTIVLSFGVYDGEDVPDAETPEEGGEITLPAITLTVSFLFTDYDATTVELPSVDEGSDAPEQGGAEI